MSEQSILEIRPVKRESVKLVVGLAGQSGDGKTYSALQLAYGLAGKNPEKIGFLDTENRRGSLYSGMFSDPFLIGDLVPPFSPKRYIEAMRQFADHGVEVLVIDSISHEWEGEGGCEEIAESAIARGKKVKDWIGAKKEHKRWMNTLLFLPMHVICCVRAREKSKPRGQEWISEGVQPITEKNVMFEMTLSFLLSDQGRKRHALKLPEELRAVVGEDGYITADHGANLRDWCGGIDPLEKSRSVLRLAASQGSNALKEAWLSIGKANQRELAAFKDTLKDLALHADNDVVPDPATLPEQSW
jgi:hypothetical protein